LRRSLITAATARKPVRAADLAPVDLRTWERSIALPARSRRPARPMKRLAHRLWRLLPRRLRRSALFALATVTAPSPSPDARRDFSTVIVAGVVGARTGLAQAALGFARRIGGWGATMSVIDLAPAFLSGPSPRSPPAPPPPGGAMIIVVNGPFLPFALTHLGRALVRGRYLVAHWSWELERLPADWDQGFGRVHEIWVASAFMAGPIRARATCPVHVAPPTPADLLSPDPALGAPDPDHFTVLVMFDMGSSLARKNPLAAVAAFRRAFEGSERARLIVKMSHGEVYPTGARAVRDAVDGAANITLLTEPLDRAETIALIAGADVLLSTHRSEGFGLPLFEAMLLERVVVATGWSANIEFMTDQNSIALPYRLIPAIDPQDTYTLPGASWADVDIDAASAALIRLAEDPDHRRRLAGAARRDALAFIARHDADLRALTGLTEPKL